MTLGPKLGEGREAEVYASGADAVLKLYRPGYHGYRSEAATLAALNGHGLAPRLLGTVETGGRPGLVMERLRGPDMLTLLQRQPWRVRALVRAFAAAHLDVGRCEAPAGLPLLRPALASRIGEAPLPAALRAYAHRILDTLPDGERLCHGDLHPGNALLTTDGVRIIDWPNATRGPAIADHARTLLLMRWAAPLPGTPPISRALIAAGRVITARLYARGYRDGSRRHLRSWVIVNAAARLAEGIDAEAGPLTGLIERAWRRGEV
ncbi:phosphotransferase family protein [Actinoplanes sp. CA-054009]